MLINLSYLKTDIVIKDNMWVTAESNYRNTDIDFFSLADIISSDYIQYSPYYFHSMTKLSVNWDNSNQNILVYDIDDGMSIKECQKIFEKYTYLITTTKNHNKMKKGIVCDRYRIIFPCKNIPRGDLYFEMLSVMSEIIPMDIQVNTKTGAFLGNKDAINIYNKGIIYDCSNAIDVANYRIVNRIKINSLERTKDVKPISTIGLELKELKAMLNDETVIDILIDLGYEFRGKKFKYREDERSPSCKVYPDGYMKDFGGVFAGDVFQLLYDKYDMKLSDAINYVSKYIKE